MIVWFRGQPFCIRIIQTAQGHVTSLPAGLSNMKNIRRVLVVDDQFGALSLGLAALSPTVVADSAVLPAALAHNASLNPESRLMSMLLQDLQI